MPRVALLLLALAATPLAAQAPLPNEPVRPHVEALLALIRSGDTAAVAPFVAQHLTPQFAAAVPADAHREAIRDWHEQWAGFQLAAVQREHPGELHLVLAANGRRGRLVVAHETESPWRIRGLRLRPDEAPLGAAVTSPAVLVRRLDSIAALDRFAGTVLVAKGDRVLARHAVGLADREAKVPMRADTRLNIGSITKAFTQVAILRLAQEGKLGLDDPIGRYVDGFAPDAQAVTIRQLLRHEGGMGDFFPSAEFRADPSKIRTLDDYLRIARATPLSFPPGTRQRYSNLGYVVLGAVVQRASAMPWHDAIATYVYRPAGMTASGVLERTAPGIAQGYVGSPPAMERNTASLPGLGSPAGGTYSTVDDLHRFALALMGRTLLDQQHTWLWFNQFESGREGWGPVGIAGGAPGINAELVLNPVTRDVIVVMANRSPPSAAAVAQQLEGEVRTW